MHLKWPSYLILLENLHTFEPETGRESPDSDLRLQLSSCQKATSCRNQRRPVPVKVPVKIKLANTQRLLGKYWRKTRSQLVWRHQNVGVSASESASRVKTAVNIEQKPGISGHW